MMDDLISRQAAISIADDYMTDEAQDIRDRIVLLPSAERRGRWTTERTMEHDGEIYCDQCGWTWENLTFDRTKVKRSPYCPNCGAQMEVSE